MFEDRVDAGRQLAQLLDEHDVDIDVVLAVPRGGLPVGRAVADAFDVPLDIVAAKKLGAPGNPELAIGAAASDGSVWLNDGLIDRLGIGEGYVESERKRAAETARQKVDRYRQGREEIDLAGKRVAIVDDGVATGATTTACIERVKNADAAYVLLAVPVGPPDTVERLRGVADEVICDETPPHFSAVGQFYRSFAQVTDEEAVAYLER
ncbi:phosphoribosyltransferase [Halobacteriaceae archaeon GCM10025711]